LLHAKGKMSLRKSHREGLDLLAECSDIKSMSNTYRISGQTSFLANLMRGLFLAVAAIGGFFMLAFSAAFAFFVVAGLAIVGLVVFAFFWTRAKLFGKPFGPKAQFEAARRDMEAQFQGMDLDMEHNGPNSGPIIDAHQTPEGWSVDD